jgi:hypothetical protein
MTFRMTASILAVAGFAAAASADVPWSPASGSGSFFDYFLGHNSNTNLFGNPTLVGDSFLFFPSNFTAQSIGGNAAAATDQLNVQLVAHPGQRFTQIQIQEFGTWGLTGVGSLQDTGTMFITDLVNPRPPSQTPVIGNLGFNVQGPVGTPNTMPITTPGSGTWSGTVTINLDAIAGPNWTNIMLVFTNTLQASTTGANSVGTITKKVVDGPAIILTPTPTPGSGVLVLAGCAMAGRRRRR